MSQSISQMQQQVEEAIAAGDKHMETAEAWTQHNGKSELAARYAAIARGHYARAQTLMQHMQLQTTLRAMNARVSTPHETTGTLAETLTPRDRHQTH